MASPSLVHRKFKTDKNVETDGVWIDYGDGLRVRIARAGGANHRYISAVERLSRRYRRQVQLEVLSNEESRKLMAQVYAETVVLGWEGVTDEDGNLRPFNVANCVALFEELPDLFFDIQAHASNLAIFRQDILEVDAKN